MKPLAVSGGCCGSRTADATAGRAVPDRIRTEADLMRAVEIGAGDSAFTRTFLELLDERHAVYTGVGTPAVTRMRGALLLALGHRALPAAALPFVLEELESAHDAWLTAIAARVLRKYPEPSPSFADPLSSAVLYIQHRDDIVRLPARSERDGGGTTTAMAEVMQTIGWLGPAGTACVSHLESLIAQHPGPATTAMAVKALDDIRAGESETEVSEPCGCEEHSDPIAPAVVSDVSGVRLQDHSGAGLTFADAFEGRPSIVVFFYTRCDNPAKCPLTMYRFGSLQRLLQQNGLAESIGMAAITYDPAYDRADRLLQYAESWGAKPSPVHRILRTTDGFTALSDYFSLGVNFSASGIVNRHQLEAFVLDQRGRIAHAVTRRRWNEAHLMRLAAQLLTSPPKQVA